jgi:hypothetical protein
MLPFIFFIAACSPSQPSLFVLFSLLNLSTTFFGELLLRDFDTFDQNFLLPDCAIKHTRIGLSVEFLLEFAHALVLFALVRVEDVLGQMPVSGNSADFVTVTVLLYQLLTIFDRSLLTGVGSTRRSPGHTFPHSQIHIFRP